MIYNNKYFLQQFLGLLLFAFIFSSCSNKEIEDPTQVKEVLLVYLGGDNNLAWETNAKLDAIEKGWKGSKEQKILVYQDATGKKPQLIEVGGKFAEEYTEENSADPTVLRRVITRAKNLYPTARFNFLVFSHASGWLPSGEYNNPSTRSILIDGKDEMEITDFAAAIPDGMFHTIYLEACFTAGIEVVYELKDKAKYIAGSSAEILSPGFTDLYMEQVNLLLGDKPQLFMNLVFDYYNSKTEHERSATYSIIKTENLYFLAEFIKNNTNQNSTIEPKDIQVFDRGRNLFFDFEDYYSRLLISPAQADKLEELIKDCVIWKEATPEFLLWYNGFTIKKHSGMTSYIINTNKPQLTVAYKKLKWAKAISSK